MITTVLSDIDEVISPRHFLRREMNDFADRHLADFVREHRSESAVRRLLDSTAEFADLPSHDAEILVAQLKAWMPEATPPLPLAEMRRAVAADGLRRGRLRAKLYADAVRTLRDCFERRIDIYTFAGPARWFQDIFFAHTVYGDVRVLFNDFFDRNTGAPDNTSSYGRIAEAVGSAPAGMLFVSATNGALDAAREAGLVTIRLCRSGEAGTGAAGIECDLPVVASFDDIDIGRIG